MQILKLIPGILIGLFAAACTQETRNKFGRAIQNWAATKGVLEIYAGEERVKRLVEIDMISTAGVTQGVGSRPYRFGYGVLDENLDAARDPGELEVYFDFSDYSTPYVCYGAPR